jgi:hypothetical protein
MKSPSQISPDTKYLVGVEFDDGTSIAAPLRALTLEEAEKESKSVLIHAAFNGEFAQYGDIIRAGVLDAQKTKQDHMGNYTVH